MLEYHEWREPEQVFYFGLGCRIGELSGELIPMGTVERARIKEEDRAFLAAYDATNKLVAIAS